VQDSFSAIFLIIFSGIIAGANLKLIPDLQKISISAKSLFGILDAQDEDQIQLSEGSLLAKSDIKGRI
jgi:hypothetical protein